MTRRILIEIEEEGSEKLFPEIMKLIMQHVDMNCRFKVDQSIIPDILPGRTSGIKAPDCIQRGMTPHEKGVQEALLNNGRSVAENG
ncbi:hypothetical protein [Roseburia inulinivorans]|uniref:hypothetical protein n=1 Tax=Roseburia inulinivorans TaxID=360807 RepID=UPI0032C0E266